MSKFKVLKAIYWDNGGQIVKVCSKGDIVKGKVHPNGKITIESSMYPGISDYVPTDSVEKIEE